MADEVTGTGNMDARVWDEFEKVMSSHCWCEALGAFYSIDPRVPT